jgi:signal transduction histidine kinase
MKLTKQSKADLATAYQRAMEVSILDMKAPLRYINQYIAENVSGFGTAADEKVKSREDYRRMIMAGRQQSKGMLFKVLINTSYRPKFIDETTAQFRDEIVVQIGDKKNQHSLHLRFSTLFKCQHGKWQMVMFHGSMPDAASSTEDTFHIGEAEKKVKELEQVVAQRTADLQRKTRELEIEASLERVRAVTMGMNTPGDILNICKVFFSELQSLGFKDLRNTLINFWDDANGQLHDYDYSDFSGGNFAKLAYSSHPTFEEFQKKIRKAKDAFAKLVIDKKGLKSWQQRRRSSGEYKDPRLNKISALYYYFYSTGVGALGISTFSPISKEEVEVLKKFRNVFDMAYQRYADIQKAEAQAKEAKIEAALERVRSRSMAMHKSDELKEVIKVVLEQFVHLNINAEHAGFYIDYKTHDDMHIWLADPNIEPFYVTLPYFDTPTWNSFLEAKAKGTIFHTDLLDFKTKNKFYKSLFKIFTVPEKAQQFYLQCKGLAVSTVLLDNVGLYIENFSAIPYTDEENKILLRFGKVFQQTYTRFLDLQKAEAQAREVQIEVSLERVRSRAMAMQSPDELGTLIGTVFTELTKLDLALTRCIIWIFEPATSAARWWMANSEEPSNPMSFYIRYHKHPAYLTFVKEWKNQNAKFVYDLKGKDKINWDDILFNETELANLPDMVKNGMKAPKRVLLSASFNNFGGINVASLESLSDEHFDLLLRFAKVFDLTYTRFLDLQKAEAQAKEAQIEAALERVRSRTMAMQKSEELAEASAILFKQMKLLGIDTYSSGFTIWDTENINLISWMCNADGSMNPPFVMPINGESWHAAQYESWKKGEDFIVKDFTGPEMRSYFQYLRSFPLLDEAFKKSIAAGHPMPEKQVHNVVNFSQGNLLFITLDTCTGAYSIFKKFANAFEQTYTRFLDLQKAEAQAREAKIEAALEKVRSRSLAMHKSDELNDVVMVLFEKLKELQIPVTAVGIHVFTKGSKDANVYVCGDVGNGLAVNNYLLPYFNHAIAKDLYDVHEKGVDFFVGNYSQKQKNSFYTHVFEYTALKHLPDDIKNMIFRSSSYSISMAPAKNSVITVNDFEGKQMSEDEADVVKRFAKVFDQAYIRFLDLQKAEAQAREAQIELSLERIRAKVTAMKVSSDLLDIVVTMRTEFVNLGHEAHYFWHMRWLPDRYEKAMTSGDGTRIGHVMTLPRHMHGDVPVLAQWEKTNEPTFVYTMDAEVAVGYVIKMIELGNFEQVDPNSPTLDDIRHIGGLTFIMARTTHGEIGYSLPGVVTHPSAEAIATVVRFASVFDLAYRRFEDLKSSEKQIREAQIELALERVRARSLAMHKSEELADLSLELVKQVQALGVATWFCAFNIYDENPESSLEWGSNGVGTFPKYRTPREHVFLKYYEAGQKGETLLINTIGEDECPAHYEYLCSLPGVGDQLLQMKAAGIPFPSFQIDHVAFMKYGYVLFITYEPVPEGHDIFIRFAKVFEQTYTRFLDLQKAEAQAREAMIETSLERVRSKTMAMHNSNDVGDTVVTMFAEFAHLSIHTNRSGILIFEDENTAEVWTARLDKEGKANLIIGKLKLLAHNLLSSVYKVWKAKETFNQYDLLGDDLIRYYEAINKSEYYPVKFDLTVLPSKEFHSDFFFSEGAVFTFSNEPITAEHSKIIKRFAAVFGQTYRRYLDLQKAEAQAKEALIETALEKVRSRTMAMQNSNELQETAAVLFQEFKKLGTEDIYQVTIGIYNEEEKLIDFRVTSWAGNGEQENRSFQLDMNEPTLLQPAVAAWKENKKSLVIDLSGEALEGWLDYRNKMTGVTVTSKDTAGRRVITVAYYSKGHLSISTPVPPPQETIKTLERFAAVFDGTYTRFLDLEKAEAQTREAKIEAALEKVRSRTLAMHKSDELAETAAEVFHQLIGLGIDPNRLYIGIVNAVTKDMEMWATDEDGTGVGKKFTFNADDNDSVKKLYDGWAAKIKSVSVDMQGKELEEYFHYLQRLQIPISHGLKQKRRVQSVAYFDKGFIGMASPDEQSVQNIQLLERFAAVFNLTFTRFNDLKIAEAHALQAEQDLIAITEAKQKAEAALTELQATQKQLIQSEKMASLGELTAGIAHEIQNPLNFVNNFSEVSKELLDEMKETIEKGDTEEAKEIMNDVIQNLEKINHHGKRADAIVKGMLQHSRSSSGEKEATDINALTDEYIRLCYHGLRAKDKSFNATIKTDFDSSVGNVNVLSQDLGRVILNLLTNAFYVVNEKKQQQREGYEPTVFISTKRSSDKIEIKVRDNGNGIPSKVLDKIFQPFFTTKPTGQGTGLGLSLSYDIIAKGHGGELKVETKEGEGTEFIVVLPC